jgi:replicative DNA helicase
MTANPRVLPHSLEAELATLGSVIVHKPNYGVAASIVGADDFYRDSHTRIFRAMERLIASGSEVDYITLFEELKRTGELDECGGPAYIGALGEGVPKSTNVQHYAKIVRDKARLRDTITAANKILADAYAAEDDASAIIERGIDTLSQAIGARSSGLVSVDAAVMEYVQAIDSDTAVAPVMTGFVDLDRVVGGFKPGDLVIFAARPSVGKTSFALGVAEHVAHAGRKVVFFPIETGQQNVAAKILTHRSQVAASRLERKEATAVEYQQVAKAVSRDPVPFWIEETARTTSEIGAWCRRAKDVDGQLSAVVIDYLQLLVPEHRTDNDSADIASISHALKRLARELDVVVIALSQLSRAPEGRKDKRPQLGDLRGSGALEQDCDVAILLFREEMHSPKPENAGIAEAIVAKHRNGPTGVVRLHFNASLAQFRDLAGDF